MTDVPTLRVAHPTDDLATMRRMYQDGLELELLGEFADHDGFDGVILGRPGHPYHFELTAKRGHRAGRCPTPDHLLVLYLPDERAWSARCERLLAAGFREVASFNPYWDVRGRTFEDPEGYRIVAQNAAWPRG